MILIADSGSTKTDWRFVGDGKVLGQAKTVGFNPYYQSAESIAEELKKNLVPYLPEKVSQIFYYGTGVTNEEKAEVVKTALLLVFPDCDAIQAHSDVVGAARSLCGKTSGIACILGTGSNSCFFDGEKIAFQVPPLGFWLGDEGSGGHLGKTLLQSYLHQEMPAEIRQKFEKRFGEIDRLTVIENAYQKPFPNRYFAGFSKFIWDNRREPFLYQVAYACFEAFFQKYIQKYPNYQQIPVHFVGSVGFYYSGILRQVAADKGVRVQNILETPIAGLTLFHLQN